MLLSYLLQCTKWIRLHVYTAYKNRYHHMSKIVFQKSASIFTLISVSFYFEKEFRSFSINLLCNQCMTDDIAILLLFTTIDACIVESKSYWYIFNFSPSSNTFWKHFVSSISLESMSKFSLLIQHFLFINLVGAFRN